MNILFSAVNTVLLITFIIAKTVSAEELFATGTARCDDVEHGICTYQPVPQPQPQPQLFPQPQPQPQLFPQPQPQPQLFLQSQPQPQLFPQPQPQPQLFPHQSEEIPIEISTQPPLQTSKSRRPPIAPTAIFKNDPNIRGRLITTEEGCGYSSVKEFHQIVGGNPAKPGKYPWMVLIGYRNNVGEVYTKCGGSLITTRHVLTAAHCILSTLSFARLGEHDISSTTDGVVEDVNVIRAERHPEYNRHDKTNDIAIIYLERDVNMTLRIIPICLPVDHSIRNRSFIDYNPFLAGWGRLEEGGESANVLQELQLPILDNADCKEQYRKQGKLLSDVQFGDAVICAGRLSGGQDGCQGDSGGPLMMPIASVIRRPVVDFRFYQIGIVSYGIGCARTNTPGIYTSVPHFMDWIQEKIKLHQI
ncbi:venom protease-like [Bradysia coprophila]|uniref:venom protease-like n=1 Tax=Bradysia coprophila TaxID=38358 RepID=UPI00187DBC35|nr:venom protease-like [Bradysia coprophila]